MSEPRPSRPESAVGLALAALLVVLGGSGLWARGHLRSAGIDFYQFWLVGNAAPAAQDNVYSPEGRRALAAYGSDLAAHPDAPPRLRAAVESRPTIETFSTPFLYTMFAAASTGDFEVDFNVQALASLVLCGAAVLLLTSGMGWSPVPAMSLVALLFIGANPLLSDVRVGNITCFQLGALAATLALLRVPEDSNVPFAAGLVAGLSIAFKPNIALAVVLPAASRALAGRWRSVALYAAGGATAVLGAVLASLRLTGSLRVWSDWLAALPQIEATSDLSTAIGNNSIARWITETGGPNVAPVLTVAALSAVGLVLWRAPRRTGFREDLLLSGLGIVAVLLSARLTWLHYELLALPLIVALLTPHTAPKRPVRLIILGCAAAVWLGAPLDILRGGATGYPVLESAFALTALFVLGLMALLEDAPRPNLPPRESA